MKTAFCDIILIKQLYGNLLINIKIESKVWYYMEYFIHFYHLSFFFAGEDEVQGVGNRGIRKHRPGIYWTFFWSKYWQSFGQNIRRL